MPKMSKSQRGSNLNRRDFLALAAVAGSAGALAGCQTSGTLTAAAPTADSAGLTGETSSAGLDTGGISMAHFESARRKAASLVSRMTLAEKISQFGNGVPAIPRLGMPAFNYYASEALHGLIHGGPITSFPLPLAMGCSFNRALVKRVFTAVSDEVWAWHKKNGQGLAMFSPPTVNMGTRDPRWGRIGENYSEDPCLVAEMAVQTIHGMQGDNNKYLKTIACAKHFILNDTDSDREVVSESVDPRSFWEYYSRGFHACVTRGKVFTVMSSYNSMNGVPTTGNPFLLTDLLRGRWGFRGYVVSDCDAVGDIYRTHHFVANYAEAAAMAVNAGCDINCGGTMPGHLMEAVNRELIGEETLNHSLVRSITGRILLGNFDPQEQIPYSKIPISCLESPAHRELARDMARQSIVLFKNDNRTLPLKKSDIKKLAVIGPMANTCHLGNYSGRPSFRISPLRGIYQYFGIESGPSYSKRAADFLQVSGTPQTEPCAEGGQDLGYINNGSWVSYDKVLFTGADTFTARVASATRGGTMEVRLDSLTGPLVCKLTIKGTGHWQTWTNVSAPIAQIQGEHTVYLRFVGNHPNLFNVQSFSLTPASPVPQPAHSGVNVIYARGCTVAGPKNADEFNAAVKAAKEADAVLLFVGADQQVGAEAHDRTDIGLPGVQHDLARAVFAVNPKTILVISSNAPVAVNWEQDNLPAIVGGLFLGEQQGNALADVIFGACNPGGKLSTTWFKSIRQLPRFHDFNIRHGRTYMYFKGQPLYAFGHGLSYTTFDFKNLNISANTLTAGGTVQIACDITNTGPVAGDAVAQLYIHVRDRKVQRPRLQLVNFDRVALQPGQTRTVSMTLAHSDQALRYWDEARHDFVLEAATVDIMLGSSSDRIHLRGKISVAGEAASAPA